ncbi:T9SS type A sorting domain-containing protein [Tenacibaculum piscium]|uniref:T9SS type A sorting domain-containing protein n=1 Tax=Tenacibaculum piscium TaxID=1458515 RepID=UPI001F329007|nr:T9SS type A sorting domain-containing protein [Tenacibaculum piscium]
MKHTYFLKVLLGVLFLTLININARAQSAGSLVFVGFNADGDKDLSIATLADIPANSTIYITDKELDNTGKFTNGEGYLTWLTGTKNIDAGTIINFTDIDNATNLNFGVSIGSITRNGRFNLTTTTKDGLFIYLGTDANTPTTFITAIQIGNDPTQLGTYDADGITLTGTGLQKGKSIIIFDASATPDGAIYKGDKVGQATLSNYYSLIADVKNWKNVVNGNGEDLLPFSTKKFSIINATWNGNIDTNWTTKSNWTPENIPTETSDVLIPNGLTNYPTINAPITIKGIKLESGASLIANAKVTGTIIYQQDLNTNWHLISSPLNGETIENLINNHNFAKGSAAGRIGIAPYQNEKNKWLYQNKASEGNIEKGTGLTVKLITAGKLKFSGNINDKTIHTNISKNKNGYNLIGNPYTSHLNTATFLTENSNILASQTIWIWNGNNYETKVTTDNYIIAPTQAYFIDAKTTGTVSFDIKNQEHQKTNTSHKKNRPEIQLTATNNNKKSNTKLYYINGTTTGFDNGYDGAEFGGVSYDFSICSQLVSENKGQNYAIQSLPINNMENTVIPIGLKANLGNEIIFSANSINLPSNVTIYLEDKINNNIINLSEENYTIQLKNNSTGIGQFYLHTKTEKLKENTPQKIITKASIKIYASKNNSIKISGLQTENASINVYSIVGKKVFSTNLTSTVTALKQIQEVNLPKLTKGVYIVEVILNSDNKISQKIILD